MSYSSVTAGYRSWWAHLARSLVGLLARHIAMLTAVLKSAYMEVMLASIVQTPGSQAVNKRSHAGMLLPTYIEVYPRVAYISLDRLL